MTEYRSSNVPTNPVDRLVAASPHADDLHNRNDRDLWFNDTPYRRNGGEFLAARGTVAAATIAAGVRCCVPPDEDTPHDAYCPVYGYPPPVQPPALPDAAVVEADPVCEHGKILGACSWGGCPHLFRDELYRDEQPETRDLTEDARRAVGMAPTLPYGTMLPENVAASWEDLATFAFNADARIRCTPDGFLWCAAMYDGSDRCVDTDAARFNLAMGDDQTPVRQLVIWLAIHWGCTQ